jgi:hypothetical protein
MAQIKTTVGLEPRQYRFVKDNDWNLSEKVREMIKEEIHEEGWVDDREI